MALTQSHYRFGIDSGTESTHGWHAAENVVPTGLALDATFLLRFNVQATASVAHANIVNQFQYSHNGGAFTNITTTSSVVRAVAATALTNSGNCTKRLSGTGTFETTGAGQTEDGNSGGTANDLAANGCSETECGLQILSADVANGDTIAFRLTCSPTAITTYAQTPTITVVETAGIVGTLSTTLAPATGSSSASLTLVGSTSRTLAAVVGSSQATSSLAGSLSRTLGALSGSSTASLPLAASLSRTLAPLSVVATGSVQAETITGTLARTLAPMTAAASGSARVTGNLARTLAPAGVSASASISVAGQLAAQLGALQGASAGELGEAPAEPPPTPAPEAQPVTTRENISTCIPSRYLRGRR